MKGMECPHGFQRCDVRNLICKDCDDFSLKSSGESGPCPSCASLQEQIRELEDALVEQMRISFGLPLVHVIRPENCEVFKLLARRGRFEIIQDDDYNGITGHFLSRPEKPAEKPTGCIEIAVRDASRPYCGKTIVIETEEREGTWKLKPGDSECWRKTKPHLRDMCGFRQDMKREP
jgi:hypothetical protein